MAVHQASRVVAAAHGGQVLVSEQVEEAARGAAGIGLTALGRFRLRDFDTRSDCFKSSANDYRTNFRRCALPAEGNPERQSRRIHWSPAVSGGLEMPVVWWRRRELNPRPSARDHQIYMLSFVY